MPVIYLPENDSTNTTTIRALTTAFKNIKSDAPGQLYAYYYCNTSVVLGTRLSVTPSDSLETAVGVLEVADATYRCIARTFGLLLMKRQIFKRHLVSARQSLCLQCLRQWYVCSYTKSACSFDFLPLKQLHGVCIYCKCRFLMNL